MMKRLVLTVSFCLLVAGCAAQKPTKKVYPRKPDSGSERKAGPAMLLYEQAEKDADINENVIVTPPPEQKENGEAPAQ